MADEIKQPNHRREHWMSYILPVALIAGLVALLTIIADRPSEELQPIIPEEEWLTHIAGYLIIAAEAAAALVIGSAVITAIISYIRHLFDGLNKQINYTERIRLRLGHIQQITTLTTIPKSASACAWGICSTWDWSSPWAATSCGWQSPPPRRM
jgi:hypothetical protein